MLSCKKASELIDKSDETKLSLMERLKLRFHVAMCDGCKSYQKQSSFITTVLNRNLKNKSETTMPQFENEPLKEKIISELEHSKNK